MKMKIALLPLKTCRGTTTDSNFYIRLCEIQSKARQNRQQTQFASKNVNGYGGQGIIWY